jgi:hypothetical protein
MGTSSGDKRYGSVSHVYESNAPAGAHSCGSQSRQAGSFGSHFVENGVGTRVQGVAFKATVSYNDNNEPCVSIYPYKLPRQAANLHDQKITDCLHQLAKKYMEEGVAVSTFNDKGFVTGHKQVAPRRVVCEEAVLDFHARGPAEWIPPGADMHLQNMKFTPRK